MFAIITAGLIGLFILKKLVDLVKARKNSSDFCDAAEDVALASRVLVILTAFFAYFLAPAGIAALFINPPLIVVIVPVVITFAGGAYVLYAFARLYDKRKNK